jgi:hypothetical protein
MTTGLRFLFLAVLASSSLMGCLGTSEAVVDPDKQFGHRVDGESPDGRRTIIIQAPDSTDTFRFFPATVQSVTVRPDQVVTPVDEGGVSVEVLVKGAFPDACTELHDVSQVRTANIIRIDLVMRRRANALCASVLRPYRFYLTLEGTFAVGPYTLFLNDRPWPFEIRSTAR